LSSEAVREQLSEQDKMRQKIVTRISSTKIEKMVKQSNQENKIDIVSTLVEGKYVLPSQMTTSSGKSVIHGTLQSLKLFEKIIKQTDQDQIRICNVFPNLKHRHSRIDSKTALVGPQSSNPQRLLGHQNQSQNMQT
jgi:hypothetical protein